MTSSLSINPGEPAFVYSRYFLESRRPSETNKHARSFEAMRALEVKQRMDPKDGVSSASSESRFRSRRTSRSMGDEPLLT